ncbi:uncharacterized protein LOC132608819 isoform X5 [Lycium barbarum]|uniref:uncharacterized protein LOC132608819 isoform X5 n=1 Tax=Lycium barbarum TaxID=112863 RepID=UPI00293E8A6D|nr:uncharacterized protein LOC132608819 isoform X5 [Lycium barbarum]
MLCGIFYKIKHTITVIRAFAGEKECKGMRRGRALRRFDKELAKGNYKAAHSLLKQLQYKTGGLLGFGSAKLVPKRLPAMNGQELCMVDESLVDSVLCSIKYSIEFALSDEEHEAGHFLVGYLVGVLPRSYQVPRVEDITQDKFAQGNVQFLGFEFLKEVDMSTISSKSFTQGTENRAKISSQTLNRFLCVILGGLAAEQLIFGYSELLHSDVQKVTCS